MTSTLPASLFNHRIALFETFQTVFHIEYVKTAGVFRVHSGEEMWQPAAQAKAPGIYFARSLAGHRQ